MIKGLPLQTASPGKHTRGYGCYAHVLAAMAQDQCGEALGAADLLKIILEAIRYSEIRDNDIPTTIPGWARCFVLRPQAFMRRVSAFLGHGLIECHEVSRKPEWDSEPTVANYAVIEHETKGKDSKGNDYTGSHFTLGEIDAGNWGYQEVYNPWPELSTLTGKIISVRKWEVRR